MFLHTVLLKAASTLKAMALSLGDLWAGDLAHAESSPSCAGGQEGIQFTSLTPLPLEGAFPMTPESDVQTTKFG